MTKPDLLPCPFCGGETQIRDHGFGENTVAVGCCIAWNHSCDFHPLLMYPISKRDAAITAWNTRTPSSTRANDRGDEVEVEQCPNCGGDGYTVEVRPNCCGKNEDGSCDGGCPVPEQYQEPCPCGGRSDTPQPSPQSEMVAVPREVIEKAVNGSDEDIALVIDWLAAKGHLSKLSGGE